MSGARVRIGARGVAGVAALLSACELGGPALETASLELALSDVPPEVASVTVVVRRGDEVVASATVAPQQRAIPLGVPAEVPLDITVLARTDRAGPAGIGRMPAYAGRLVRSVPLAADITRVAITLRPAGVLTVVVPPAPDVPRTPVVFEPLDGDQRGPRIRLREAGFTQSYVVRAGHYRARFDLDPTDDGPPFALDATGAVFVAREQETLFVLAAPETPELEPESVASVAVGTSADELVVDAPMAVTVTATAVDGTAAVDPAASARWRALSAPDAGAMTTAEGAAEGLLGGLPAALVLRARAPGRVWLTADVALGDGRALSASRVVEVHAAPGAPAGPAAAVVARVADGAARRTGTQLLLELVDARGAYARTSTATLDLSRSDPWVDLGGPPVLRISPRDRGRVVRRISVPSGQRGRSVAIRITATSTTTGLVSTATVTLPPLELP